MRKTFIDFHIKILHALKTEEFVCERVCVVCLLCLDRKVCWFSLILSFGSVAGSSICPMLLWMCDACAAIFERFLLATTWTHTHTSTTYSFIRSLLRFPSQFTITQQQRWRRRGRWQSRHSTNSLVHMFVIHLACLFRYRLLQLMRNRQMYLRLSTLTWSLVRAQPNLRIRNTVYAIP